MGLSYRYLKGDTMTTIENLPAAISPGFAPNLALAFVETADTVSD